MHRPLTAMAGHVVLHPSHVQHPAPCKAHLPGDMQLSVGSPLVWLLLVRTFWRGRLTDRLLGLGWG